MNLDVEQELTSEILSERYYSFIDRNSPEKEGSAYITAKIENAKDALVAHYGLSIIEREVVIKDTTAKDAVDKDSVSEAKKEAGEQDKQEPKN